MGRTYRNNSHNREETKAKRRVGEYSNKSGKAWEYAQHQYETSEGDYAAQEEQHNLTGTHEDE